MSNIAEEINKRRTFAIISHPDAGKTTLTEKFLLYGGAINLAGSVKGKATARHAVSDWMEIEKERGISVTSSVLQFNYDGYCINILDTPGHQDFSEDTYRTLMAADSAVMVIDASKGVEAQTRKLFKVCGMRGIPIFTFINKMDRDANDTFELLDEIEKELGIATCPVNWPIGSGKRFKGVYDRHENHVLTFSDTEKGTKEGETTVISMDDEDTLLSTLGEEALTALRDEIDLLDGASAEFDLDEVRRGKLTPVFFGSALTNFGVEVFLQNFLKMATTPLPRISQGQTIDPVDNQFSAFVFKIQANMDPRHRDRIAFFRVCSGVYQPGMKVRHVREGREMKIANALTFMANERVHMQEAYAGDIIGIYNHGQLHIGDTLTEGETLGFTGIPYFAPELFRSARARDPLKGKQLHQGLKELGEEGAIQVFEGEFGNLMLGAVGQLQFEIVAQRLATEYKVDAIYESTDVSTARWLVFPDEKTKKDFCEEQAARLARDSEGNICYMATSIYNLMTTQKHWPQVQFLTTREQGQKFE